MDRAIIYFFGRDYRVYWHRFREGKRSAALCFGQLYFLKRRFEVVDGVEMSRGPQLDPLLSSRLSTSASQHVLAAYVTETNFSNPLSPTYHNLP